MQTNGRIQLFPLLRIAVAMAIGIVVGYESRGLLSPVVWLAGLVVAAVATVVAGLGGRDGHNEHNGLDGHNGQSRHNGHSLHNGHSGSLGRLELWQGALIMVSFVFLGGFLVTRQQGALDRPLPRGYVTYRAVVASHPQVRGKTLRMDLWLLDDEAMPRRVKASLLRNTASVSDIPLEVGDGIVATSRMKRPENYYSSNFDYPLYLRCHGFTATTLIAPDAWRKAVLPLDGLSRLERARLAAMRFRQHTLRQYLGIGLSDDEMAVAVAMALGDKSRITNDLRDIYSISGASHVLALSGLHLGIIYMLLSLVLGARRRSVLREVLIILGIWSYALFTGLSPSVVRASLMITVYSFVGLVGRDRMSLNALSFTAIVMLLSNPLCLYDVGFQMSFLAVMAILIFYKPLNALVPATFLEQHRLAKWMWAMVVVSCSAQLGVAPLTAYYFGRFSTYFLLTNFFVIPLATVILYLTALLFASAVVPPLMPWVAKALAMVVGWQNTLATWVASMPGSSVEHIHITRIQLLLVYVVIAALATIGYKVLRLKNKI